MRNLILLLSVFILLGCVQRGDTKVTKYASKDFRVHITIQKEDKEIKEFLEL